MGRALETGLVYRMERNFCFSLNKNCSPKDYHFGQFMEFL